MKAGLRMDGYGHLVSPESEQALEVIRESLFWLMVLQSSHGGKAWQ